MTDSQYGLPVIVGSFEQNVPAQSLRRVDLEKSGTFNEAWLQHLIMRNPSLLPIEQIEPAFTPAIPICMELCVPSGYVDNLYATPTGDLIIGETKLFRNPQARREVIGQIIDYAKELSVWSYAELDDAVRKATPPSGDTTGAVKLGLYETVLAAVGPQGLNEAQFIDAVSRNLARGRFLLLIIGDGIQEQIERLTNFLQQHAGLHFTLALVDLAVFELPTIGGSFGGYMVQPRIIARTVTIERGIVTIQDGQIAVRPPADKAVAGLAKRTTITEEIFFEQMNSICPGIVPKLRDFTDRLEAISIIKDFGTTSMILRWPVDEKRVWTLANIQTKGDVWTEFLNAQADAVGLLHLSHQYLKRIASCIPGAYVKDGLKPTSSFVAANNGKYIKIDDLVPHADAWYAAIQEFTTAVTAALKNQ